MFKPEIHFNYTHHYAWIGADLNELYNEMEKLRIAVKKASNYYWDSSIFFINDLCGYPALKVLFSESSISFWNARNGCSLGTFDTFGTKESKELDSYIANVSKGLTRCNVCKAWFKDFKSYSFAGAVCKDCYDPERHLPPDTSGD